MQFGKKVKFLTKLIKLHLVSWTMDIFGKNLKPLRYFKLRGRNIFIKLILITYVLAWLTTPTSSCCRLHLLTNLHRRLQDDGGSSIHTEKNKQILKPYNSALMS